jgi:hypothetical protein
MLIPASPSRGAARSNLSRTVSQLHVRNLGLSVICALLIENRFGGNVILSVESVEFCVVLGVRRISSPSVPSASILIPFSSDSIFRLTIFAASPGLYFDLGGFIFQVHRMLIASRDRKVHGQSHEQ